MLLASESDGIVLHPNDWQEIRLIKDADGLYVLGEPANDPPERLFGLGVVVPRSSRKERGSSEPSASPRSCGTGSRRA